MDRSVFRAVELGSQPQVSNTALVIRKKEEEIYTALNYDGSYLSLTPPIWLTVTASLKYRVLKVLKQRNMKNVIIYYKTC